nr:hypothetical protein [Tanacetum cinerariifolium]
MEENEDKKSGWTPQFPSGFPLRMVPPKNLDERNSLVPHDSILTIQNSL